MERVIGLLGQRNMLLGKYMSLNEAQMIRLAQGDFDGIDEFYHARETVLEMIQRTEASMQISLAQIPASRVAQSADRSSVEVLLRERNELVTEILEQDLEILSLIERAKSEIIEELASLRRSRKLANKYHSGETIRNLDEEV
jgi:hypothetical protein